MKKVFTSALVVLVLSIVFSVSASAADVVDTGYCGGEGDGTNLSWTLFDDGTLRVQGNGAMADYYGAEPPWHSQRSSIKKIEIVDGITRIGNFAFNACAYTIGNLVLPTSVQTIGERAFLNCGFEGILILPKSITSIGDYAFYGCDGFTSAYCFHDAIGHLGNLPVGVPIYCAYEAQGWIESWNGYTCYLMPEKTSSTISLDLADGSIEIFEYDNINYCLQNSSWSISPSNIIIRQTYSGSSATSNTITVNTGNCAITISSLNITSSSKCPPINIRGDASLLLTNIGSTTLSAGWGVAGIQVSNNADVTIAGSGSITTTGGLYGAGIGGGYKTDGGSVTLQEGTIIAKGGDYAAGIGCGRDGNYVSIVINGGNITATAGESYGAGIGGGRESALNTITINGGTLVASGGYYGAGIGQGYSGESGIITINNGTITAIGGGRSASGIGDGNDGFGSCVIINGGTVEAEGCWAADIKADSVTVDSSKASVIVSPDSSHPGVLETIFVDAQPITSASHIGNIPLLFVTAYANSGLSYQWQYSYDNGESWINKPLEYNLKIQSTTMTEAQDGCCCRCLLTNGWGNTLYTDKVQIFVLGFSKQPTSVNANLNETISFEVTSSCPNVTYQWQRSYDNCQTWSNVDGETYSTLIVNASLSESSAKYRCVITATNGDSLASDTVEINLDTEDLVTYTVQFFLQNTDGNGYTLSNQMVKEGTSGETATAPEAFYEGFLENTVKSTVSGTIANDSSLILNRYFDRNTYSISFDMNGGSSIPAIDALYGTAVEAPNEPSRYGYRFAGWFSDENFENEFVFDTMPLNGVTVYAKWEPVGSGRGIEYQPNGISIRNCNTYEIIDAIPTNAFLVEVSVTNLSSTTTDTIILSYYKENGQFIGMQYLYANPQIGQTLTFGSYVENNNGDIAIIKAFVLPTLGNPIPLASCVEFK